MGTGIKDDMGDGELACTSAGIKTIIVEVGHACACCGLRPDDEEILL